MLTPQGAAGVRRPADRRQARVPRLTMTDQSLLQQQDHRQARQLLRAACHGQLLPRLSRGRSLQQAKQEITIEVMAPYTELPVTASSFARLPHPRVPRCCSKREQHKETSGTMTSDLGVIHRTNAPELDFVFQRQTPNCGDRSRSGIIKQPTPSSLRDHIHPYFQSESCR
jgi:hypothetical protein